ncbi:SGNH hydrolase [Aspergillus ambiguus]|uniref:SGNH/GDSL hydrolase family protein n=1 Tax=Aspergillus ambiguus TaxID=176160 RepID=UPI003CCD2402
MSQKISILCFGNSLTAGYHQFGLDYHPYAWKLEEKLKAAFPSHTFQVDVDGLPGDLVIHPPGRFLPRLQRRCAEISYDWVIVLGATNDLGHGYPCARIFPALQDAWHVALGAGAKVLALTVPECAAVSNRLDDKRGELNSQILGYQCEKFHAFDLHPKVPYHSATEEFRKTIWDDGLHLTPAGYDLVGSVIADHLIQLLGSDGKMEK